MTKRPFLLWWLALSCSLSSIFAQSPVTSPPPAELVFVANPNGFYFAKHPKLPVLYVGCYVAPEHKNLVTYPLNSDGTVNTNGMKSFNYFSENPTNDLYRHQVMRPIVLPEERILYLACTPEYPQFYANTNHQEMAAVALDDQGQPGKILKAFRPSYSENEVRGWQWDPTTHRIYISCHLYFGWIDLGKDGLPASDKFTVISGLQSYWQWVYVPEWQRFYARQTGTSIFIFKLTTDGSGMDFSQNIEVPYSSYGNLQVSQKHLLLYSLNIAPNAQLVTYPLTHDGRFTGVPRYFPLGDAIMMRINFGTGRLYAVSAEGVLQTYTLDGRGVPKGPPQISALHCGGIRDMLVDEPSGKIYILCSEPPKNAP